MTSFTYAEDLGSASESIGPMSNKFINVIEYSPEEYEYLSTSILTADDITKAMVGGTVTLNIIAHLLGVPTGYLLGADSIYVLITQVYMNNDKDYKTVNYSRYKMQYQVNVSTGKKTLLKTWLETKSQIYIRDTGGVSWTFHKTTYDSIVMK